MVVLGGLGRFLDRTEVTLDALVGRVSMDMLTVDVTDCGAVAVGTRAILWGDDPAIDAVAEVCGTIGYELMTRMTGRAPRCYEK